MSKSKAYVKLPAGSLVCSELLLLSPRAFRALLIMASWAAEWGSPGQFPVNCIAQMVRVSKRSAQAIIAELTVNKHPRFSPPAKLEGEILVLNENFVSCGRDGVSWDMRDTKKVLARDGHNCRYCGVGCFEDLTFDHVFPRSRGGSDNHRNLVVACQSCNSRKNDRTPEEANMPLLPVPENA